MVVDTLSNLVHVSVNPGYPYNYTTSLCAHENDTNSLSIHNSVSACLAIYLIEGGTGRTKDIIRLGHGELIDDIQLSIK